MGLSLESLSGAPVDLGVAELGCAAWDLDFGLIAARIASLGQERKIHRQSDGRPF